MIRFAGFLLVAVALGACSNLEEKLDEKFQLSAPFTGSFEW